LIISHKFVRAVTPENPGSGPGQAPGSIPPTAGLDSGFPAGLPGNDENELSATFYESITILKK
jgi:hypothetical protein